MAAVDDFLVQICNFAMENGDQKRAQGVFERIIGHSNNKRQEIAQKLADSYKNEGIYSKAYKYYFKSRNETEICNCLEKIIEYGYDSEKDLFIARACLDMLIKSKDLDKTRAIRNHFRTSVGNSALLNFIDFLIEALGLQEFGLIKQMATKDYEKELSRDSSLFEKVNTICEKYFSGQSIKEVNPMQVSGWLDQSKVEYFFITVIEFNRHFSV